jgi:hypothetical protein
MHNKVGYYRYSPSVVFRQLQTSYNFIGSYYNMEHVSSGTTLLSYILEASVRLPIWELSTLTDSMKLLCTFQIMLCRRRVLPRCANGLLKALDVGFCCIGFH